MSTNNYKLFIGRAPTSTERLSEGLRSLGHRVTVFVSEPEGELSAEQEKGVVRFKVLYQRADRGVVLGNYFDGETEALFREGNSDVIHVRRPVLVGQTALYLGKRYNILVAYIYHTRYEKYLHHFKLYEAMAFGEYPVDRIARYGKEILIPALTIAFSNQCDLISAPASTMRDHLPEQGTKTRVSVLPTGLDRISFRYDEMPSSEIRNMYGSGCPYLFTATTRLEREKNLDFLFRGTARLRDILGQNFRLMVIRDNAGRCHLEELARILGISRQIVFMGKIENTRVRHYLNATGIFLLASGSEAQGIVLLETMAAGYFVAAIRTSGVVDATRQGINGYTAEEAPEAFATAAARLVLERGV